jgi:ubiquinone/menaquinone biosynthesis C-methylase UbiE
MSRQSAIWWKLVRIGFRLLYNELAWTYDAVAWVVSLGQWSDWQRASLKYLDPVTQPRLLELAHGTGTLHAALLQAGYDVIGLDLSPAMGRIARRKLLRHGLSPRLVRGSGLALPFAGESFDAIVSTFPTPFIIHPDTLRELHRVLIPGGRLVVVVNGLLTAQNVAANFLEWAYRITGQRSRFPESLEPRIHDAGFTFNVTSEPLPGSTVVLAIFTRGP